MTAARRFLSAALLAVVVSVSACGGGGSSEARGVIDITGTLTSQTSAPLASVQVTAAVATGVGTIGLVDADTTDAAGRFDLSVSQLATGVDLTFQSLSVDFALQLRNIPAGTARIVITLRYSLAAGELISHQVRYEDSQGGDIGPTPTPTAAPTATPTPSPAPVRNRRQP